MKVVHVVRQFHPSIGGMEEVVLNVARQHQATSADTVEVVTLDRVFTDPGAQLAQQETYQGLPIRRIGYRGSSRYPLAPSVLSAIRSADLVHLHGIDFFYDYLALTRPLHGKPMVVSTHGGFFHTAYASRMKQLWFQTLTRTSALAYARVIATSENDGELFAKVVSPARLRVIENGVDVEKYAGRAQRRWADHDVFRPLVGEQGPDRNPGAAAGDAAARPAVALDHRGARIRFERGRPAQGERRAGLAGQGAAQHVAVAGTVVQPDAAGAVLCLPVAP